MRLSKTVNLGPDRDVLVQELRVRDVRAIIEGLPLHLVDGMAPSAVPALLREHLPELLRLAEDALVLPAGETVDDLPLSETATLAAAWWGLHRAFFDQLGLAAAASPAPSDTP